MKKTVVGVFDTPVTAHAAEERLISHGIDQSALHLDSQVVVPTTVDHSGQNGLRHLFAELLGTPHPEEAESAQHSDFILAVDVPDDIPLQPVSKTLLDAGALNIHERVEQ